jgi:hypothetical protein
MSDEIKYKRRSFDYYDENDKHRTDGLIYYRIVNGGNRGGVSCHKEEVNDRESYCTSPLDRKTDTERDCTADEIRWIEYCFDIGEYIPFEDYMEEFPDEEDVDGEYDEEELIEQARESYPIGTYFIPRHTDCGEEFPVDKICIIINDIFLFDDDGDMYAKSESSGSLKVQNNKIYISEYKLYDSDKNERIIDAEIEF